MTMRKSQQMCFFISAAVLALTFTVATETFCQSADASDNAAVTPAPAPQGQVSKLGDRSFSRARNAPRRDNLNAIQIVDHVNGLLGGFEQGAGLGFGIEMTTSSGKELKGFELYGRALVSTRLYRKAEVGARAGTDNTRGEVWFGYLRRTRDNFFNIGPLSPETPETNYQIEQRSYNALFAQKILERSEVGVYAQVRNTGSFLGKDDKDPPIDVLFSGNPSVAPVARFLPGLNTNAKLFSYGVFAEIDLRNNERGLVKGGYFYGRFGSVDGLDNGNAFSDFGWTEVELDARAYIPLFSDKTSLALRAYADLKDPKRGSQIPFYDQSFFGTRNQGRGFDTFRFNRPDPERAVSAFNQRFIDIGVKSGGCVPLIVHGRKLGVLGVASFREDAFPEADQELLGHIANQIAIAVENALNFERARQAERQAAEERDRFELLLEINNAVVSHLDLKELVKTVSASLRERLPHDAAEIALYEPERNQLREYTNVTYKDLNAFREGDTIPLEGTPAGEVFLTGQPLLIGRPNPAKYPADRYSQRPVEGSPKSACLALLISYGRKLGIASA